MKFIPITKIVWLQTIRRKEIYVLLILLAVLLSLLSSLNIFGLGGVGRYIKDVGLLISWIFSGILTIVISGRQLQEEEQRRTILSIFSKPLTRWEFIFGKWFGCWTVACIATLTFYLLVIILALYKQATFQWVSLIQAMIAHWIVLGIITSVTLALSTRMNADAAITLSFIINITSFSIVPRVPEFLTKETNSLTATLLLFLYNALPHFEFLDLRTIVVHDWYYVSWLPFILSLVYGLVWVAFFLLLAWIGYRNKLFLRSHLF